MPAVRRLDEANAPSWEQVVLTIDELRSLPGEKGMTLVVDDENSLIVYYTNRGFLVTGCERGDTDYYVLTEPARGNEHVIVSCAGTDMDRPKKVFVSDTNAMQAVKHYFETGRKDSSLTWEVDAKCW